MMTPNVAQAADEILGRRERSLARLSDKATLTLIETRDAIARGAMSSVEAVEYCVDQYERLQGVTNAFIRIDIDGALSAARRADELRYCGKTLGRLHGVPVAYKDMFDRVGYRCSFGARLPQAVAPCMNAAAIQHLEQAGAILLGALNMSEFALGPTGHNATFGHCRNPRDPQRIAGGSSSGAGAAVAAGIVAGAIGSDTGGSIRIPAACCGVVGLKPTQGRVSAQGAMPLAASLDCIGPLARTAEDCALLFQILLGDQESCPDHRRAPLKAVSTLRLVYPRELLAAQLPGSVLDALDSAARTFESLGAELVERQLPDIAHLHELADTVQKSECAAAHYRGLVEHREAYTKHVRRRIDAGFLVSSPAYIRALEQRPRHTRTFVEQTLENADALLLPAIGFELPTIEETDEETGGTQPELVGRMTHWTRWLNFLGVPALSIPCGIDRHRMPIGLQLVGAPNEELRLLDIAQRYQAVTSWHRRRATFGDEGSESPAYANAS